MEAKKSKNNSKTATPVKKETTSKGQNVERNSGAKSLEKERSSSKKNAKAEMVGETGTRSEKQKKTLSSESQEELEVKKFLKENPGFVKLPNGKVANSKELASSCVIWRGFR